MVRVAQDDQTRRSARLSLIGSVVAALVGVGALLLLRDDPPQPAPQRSLTSYPVRWTCELDESHEFIANGRFEPLPCRNANCEGRCYIRLRMKCIKHGDPFDVWVQFERGTEPEDHGERIVKYRFDQSRPWQDAQDGRIPCPVPGCDGTTRAVRSSWPQPDRPDKAGDDPKP
jgi:hypothetical protein